MPDLWDTLYVIVKRYAHDAAGEIADAILADERLLVALTHNTREALQCVECGEPYTDKYDGTCPCCWPIEKGRRVRVVPIEPPTNDADRP